MTNDETNPNDEVRKRLSILADFFVIRASSLFRHSSFVIRHCRHSAFTVLELLVVIAIIIVLTGLILATTGYVQNKGARSRAEAEIAAMSAALESYKADNGIYPRDSAVQTTDKLDARTDTDPNQKKYQDASFYLFTQLSGLNASQNAIAGAKSYMSFKPQMLGGTRDGSGNVTTVAFIRDPFGNSYGYSTAYAADLESDPTKTPSRGYNPTFDLWSTGSPTGGGWVKNW